jgi:hypothetical protein
MGPIFQSSLDSFLPSLSEKESGNITNMPFNIEDLAEKIANKVAKKLGPQYGKKEKTSAIPFNPSAKLSLQSSNLIELLDEVPDFELLFEDNSRVLRCSNCAAFLSSPQASYTSLFRRPSGKADGSLATGLHLSDDIYKQLIAGKCDKWYHQKQAIHQHLSFETHNNAVHHMKLLNEGRSREMIVAKNQLRAAIGVVKTV